MNFDIRKHEIELKYNAKDVTIQAFQKFCEELKPLDYNNVSSWDTYYSGDVEGVDFDFVRHRQDNPPQLTVKEKLNENNNNQRIEVDLLLDNSTNEEDVQRFCERLGFTFNFKLFKSCYIYWYDKVDLVYYIAYDEEMREKGRFIEIEARKDRSFESAEEAWELVREWEKKLTKFGITPNHRIHKSQWEMNRRDT